MQQEDMLLMICPAKAPSVTLRIAGSAPLTQSQPAVPTNGLEMSPPRVWYTPPQTLKRSVPRSNDTEEEAPLADDEPWLSLSRKENVLKKIRNSTPLRIESSPRSPTSSRLSLSSVGSPLPVRGSNLRDSLLLSKDNEFLLPEEEESSHEDLLRPKFDGGEDNNAVASFDSSAGDVAKRDESSADALPEEPLSQHDIDSHPPSKEPDPVFTTDHGPPNAEQPQEAPSVSLPGETVNTSRPATGAGSSEVFVTPEHTPPTTGPLPGALPDPSLTPVVGQPDFVFAVPDKPLRLSQRRSELNSLNEDVSERRALDESAPMPPPSLLREPSDVEDDVVVELMMAVARRQSSEFPADGEQGGLQSSVLKINPRAKDDAESETGQSSGLSTMTEAGLTSHLADYPSLRDLTSRFGVIVDVIGVVVGHAGPDKTKGPDFLSTFQIVDPSLDTASTLTVNIFRRPRSYHPSLPEPIDGTVLLLRNFQIQSFNRKPLAVSTELSSWAVFAENGQHQIPAIPVEFGQEEEKYVKRLQSWWSTSDRTVQPRPRSRPTLKIEEVKLDMVFDLVAEVVSIPPPSIPLTIIVQDYTRNPLTTSQTYAFPITLRGQDAKTALKFKTGDIVYLRNITVVKDDLDSSADDYIGAISPEQGGKVLVAKRRPDDPKVAASEIMTRKKNAEAELVRRGFTHSLQ
ncbi:hypothetical protein SAICODRAFT_18268 [Saitoella complicata NRRL Y-17804]|nr:uncharacterized protein SAICODRAFT_18268 [Saitoella complicata NRRL Y-17804]ODQ54195.1 hypothetical protein SAICODRAFT_18268 [Saitoella complicata NRRL Y-17804]